MSGSDKPKEPIKIPQPHGGALLSGGMPGHKRGGGRVPNRVRALLAKGFAEATPRIIKIAKGEDGRATVSEELKAYDSLGKYGMGEAAAVVLESPEWLEIVCKVTAAYLGDVDAYNRWYQELITTLDSTRSPETLTLPESDDSNPTD